MLDWWEEKGPPVYVSAAVYLGLTKKKGSKKSSSAKASTADTGDLDELEKMFRSSGGMI